MEIKKRVIYHVGQHFNFEMLQPQKGKMPIAKTDDGITCIIDHDMPKGFFPYGSVWDCEITLVCHNKLVFKPVCCIITAEDNLAEIAKKANEMFGKKKTQKTKIKKSFPFLTKEELYERLTNMPK